MGLRTITGFTDSGSNDEWSKVISDLEARVRMITENAADLALGAGIGLLTAGQFFFDYENDKLYIRCSDSLDPNAKDINILTYFLTFGTWGTQADRKSVV